MSPKKRNSIILFLLFGIAAIHIFSGITIAQAGEKVTFKIQKDKKKVTEPAKKIIGEVAETSMIEEDKAKKGKEKKVAYSYDPTNKVDPFKSFIIVKKELEETEKPKTYLETLDISQLTVSAIVLTGEGNWALVRDSKGEGHIIKVGTPIGRRSGQVTKILKNKIIVKEYYTDLRGRKIARDNFMKLPTVD